MGREVRRTRKTFEWPLGETWWGYLLEGIPCQTCNGTGKNSQGEYCSTCEGEEDVSPRVEPDSYPRDKVPSWMHSFEHDYGWQMWETTSEGSPISPIFDDPQSLARWLADEEVSTFGSMTTTYERWLSMIMGPGSAPSAVIADGKMMSGVEAVSFVGENK